MPDEPLPAVREGEIINEMYKIIEEIGSGAHGKIFSAETVGTDVKVALKQGRLSGTIQHECNILRKIFKSEFFPNWLTPQRVGVSYFLVMSLEGDNIWNLMRGHNQQKLSKANLLLYMHYGIQAIKALHGFGILHRDIKADNFVLSETSDKAAMVLIDFALAEEFDRENRIFKVPTSSFMDVVQAAPQILRGGVYSETCDIFLLLFSILSIGGYNKFKASKKMTKLQRAEAHDMRFFRLPSEIDVEDKWLLTIASQMFAATDNNAQRVDYDALLDLIAAEDGFVLNGVFQF